MLVLFIREFSLKETVYQLKETDISLELPSGSHRKGRSSPIAEKRRNCTLEPRGRLRVGMQLLFKRFCHIIRYIYSWYFVLLPPGNPRKVLNMYAETRRFPLKSTLINKSSFQGKICCPAFTGVICAFGFMFCPWNKRSAKTTVNGNLYLSEPLDAAEQGVTSYLV